MRSDSGWKLKGPLEACRLPPPTAFLLPLMALLVRGCRSRNLKMKKAAACPRILLRSACPCTVRTLQRRAVLADVVRPCRKACRFPIKRFKHPGLRARLLGNGQIIHRHVFIKLWARFKLG
jgi:hypothetical protein